MAATATIRELPAHALPGTYALVVSLAARHGVRAGRALDLGAGSGAFSQHLLNAGFQVTAVDASDEFAGSAPFIRLDLDHPAFHLQLEKNYDLVTAIEVIEHLESPVSFLRSIRELLHPRGVAVLTTPNVENVPARLKFLLRGKIRTMDERSDVHISPIFTDLFERFHVPRAQLRLLEHVVHPWSDFPLTGRRWMVPFFRLLAALGGSANLRGDCHVFVLQRTE
jgi:SAM-dependent methyltransferase